MIGTEILYKLDDKSGIKYQKKKQWRLGHYLMQIRQIFYSDIRSNI